MDPRTIHKLIAIGCLFLVWGGGLVTGSCQRSNTSQATFAPRHSKLVGGQPDLQLPAVGALTRDYIVFCSGTLIAPRVVLTAGHCIDSAYSYALGQNQLRFRIDTPDPQEPGGYRTNYFAIVPRLLQRHPQWRSNHVQDGFDVGVAILREPVPPQVTSPLPFNDTTLNPPDWQGKDMLFLGYGLISSVPYAISPNRKHSVQLRITEVRSDRIVINSPGKSVCHGDSGGPALGQNNGQWRVLAVNSYALTGFAQGSDPPRTRCDGGAVSVRADAYKNFIQSWVDYFKSDSSSCQTDTDCGPCGQCSATSQACTARVKAQAVRHCLPCKQDTDCGQGLCLTLSQGRRCMAACDTTNCCPNGAVCARLPRSSGEVMVCQPWQSQCPDVTCAQNSDCSDLETCNQGTCQRRQTSAQPRQCFPCQTHADCGNPQLQCLPWKGQMRCLQRCDTNETCPQGYLCEAGGPGQSKRCLPAQGRCEVACQNDQDCPTSWTCQNQQCQASGQSSEGESCNHRPCQQGLLCVETLDGMRCLRPCGVPVGAVGGACIGERDCLIGASCLVIRGRKYKFCAAECNADKDCASGGSCTRGYCVCRMDQECHSDSFCERSFGSDTGFCVKKDTKRTCPSGQTCEYFVHGSYCITPKDTGRRWVGQTCDSLNPCQSGLSCVAFGSQASVCIELCQFQGGCRLGGQCVQGYCFCTQASDCPQGRVCQRFIEVQGTWGGICVPVPGAVSCRDDRECGQGQQCIQGQCVAQTSTEPTESEPTPEPTSREEKTTAPEPTPEPTRDAGTSPEQSSPREHTATHTHDELSEHTQPPPADGCRCSAAPLAPSQGTLWIWLGLLLWLGRLTRGCIAAWREEE